MNILYDIQDYLKSLYHRIKMRVLATNAPYNAGYIRKFLCAVLNFYGEFIKLPVRDISTIPYVGYQIRNDTIFYRYCITCPEEPENMDHIRDLLNSYIWSALREYGIDGLQAVYNGYLTLYVDRVFYQNHIFSLDIAYVSNNDALQYCKTALERESQSETAEQTVHDDDL